ncbi:MAG: COX15/CtaA family protein [Phycisphaerales bacterium]|nr:COX15/CtaA family protein [Phycisphaerales bacterium]
MIPQTLPSESDPKSPLGAALSIGFFASTLLWVLAWGIHVPGIHLPVGVTIAAMIVVLLGISLLWLPAVAQTQRTKAGLLAGTIYGLLNLLILGSFIAEQPESLAQMPEQANQLQPSALPIILGSLAISIAIGFIASLLTKSKARPTLSTQRWIARFGWITALSYLPLIAVGGLVTSTDSGLAVPDGVTSYGAISVLFPLKLMGEPRIFFEHSHRLFGTLAGLTTLVLMLRVLLGHSTKVSKAMAVTLFVGVSIQGIMGALRVSQESTALAILHGVFAQLILALAACTAISLGHRWNTASPSPDSHPTAKRTRMMMGFAFAAILLQLILGAVTRHLHSSHMMMAHMGFAMVVVALIIVGGSFCIRLGKSDPECKGIRPYGAIMHGLVVLQFVLGFAVLGMVWTGDEPPELPTSETLSTTPQTPLSDAMITTVHQLVGALLFAAAACALFWALKLACRRKIG